MLRNSGPRLGGSTTTPVPGSTGPGEDTPIPAICSATSRLTPSRAARAAMRQCSTLAAGPSAVGVPRSMRARRVPSGRTTAARIRVPPRSTAMTGREDRAKPLGLRSGRSEKGLRILAARHFQPGNQDPRRFDRRGSTVLDEEWLAADLEHLGPALGTGAGQRLLAILHDDLLR